MKIYSKYAFVACAVFACPTLSTAEGLPQSCTKTSRGMDRCRIETGAGSITVDTDPITKKIAARYLTFEKSSPPRNEQMLLLAKTMYELEVPKPSSNRIISMWVQCMNTGDTIGAVEAKGMTWSFSNPIDDICGIDILVKKDRGRAY